jgi:exodeoxyribonuclease III
LKIATYNVNSIRSRLHIVLPWLQNNQPDIFCIQETKVEDARFPVADFEALGYVVTFRGNKQYNGVAIASRNKPQKVAFGLLDEPADSDRLAMAQFDDWIILNVYVPQGQDVDKPQFAYKLAWLHRLKQYLEKNFKPDQKLILCGDFNVAPGQMDVHDPKRILGHVSFNPDVWKAYEDVVSWGVTDVFRRHHPNEPGQYTFFDYRVRDSVGRNLGWRVDHILATKTEALESSGCKIDLAPRLAEKPSDHTVIYAEWEGKS